MRISGESDRLVLRRASPDLARVKRGPDQKLLRALSTPGLLDEVARAEPALWQSPTPPDIKDGAPIGPLVRALANR